MANVQRWDPFDDIDDLFKGFFLRPMRMEPSEAGGQPVRIKIDVKEDDKAYVVHAEVPGVKKEDINVTVDGAQVTLAAEVKREKEATENDRLLHTERSFGKVTRTFTLPQELDEAKVEAKFRDGVLELALPKKAAAQRKAIAIQ